MSITVRHIAYDTSFGNLFVVEDPIHRCFFVVDGDEFSEVVLSGDPVPVQDWKEARDFGKKAYKALMGYIKTEFPDTIAAAVLKKMEGEE